MGASFVFRNALTCLRRSFSDWTVRINTLGHSLPWRLGVAVVCVCGWIPSGSPGLVGGHADTQELCFRRRSPRDRSALLFFASILCRKKTVNTE